MFALKRNPILFEVSFKNGDLDSVKLTCTIPDGASKSKKCPMIDGSGGIEDIFYVENRFRKIASQLNMTT